MDNFKYKAGLYIRLSRDDDKEFESSSIVNQKSYISEYVKSKGIEIYDYYVDDGYSGGNFLRPGFKRLIQDIENGFVNCVVVKDTSRLGREFIETGNYIFKYFPEHNVRFIAILEGYDSFNSNGVEDIIPFKTVINDMYLKDTSRKIKSARHSLMKKGLYVGSSVPYGYKRSLEDSRLLVIDEYASLIVKEIFSMRDKGFSTMMIARNLTDRGILPPNLYKGRNVSKNFTTNLWKASTIKGILSNEVYTGTLVQGKYERVSLKSKKRVLLPREKWIINKNNHESIISYEVFERVNCKNSYYDIRKRKYDYLLKGLVVCADCGKVMLVRRCKRYKDEVYAIYCCRSYATYRNNVCTMHYYREDLLNELVLGEIKNLLNKYVCFDRLLEEYEKIFNRCSFIEYNENLLRKDLVKLREIDKSIASLYKDKSNGIILDSEFIKIKEFLVSDRDKISSSIVKLREEINLFNEQNRDINIRKKIISDFLEGRGFNKLLIRELINKITIDKDKCVRIYYNFKKVEDCLV